MPTILYKALAFPGIAPQARKVSLMVILTEEEVQGVEGHMMNKQLQLK
jgi:hypothetical protein